jgi:hypothetical protein
MMPQALMTSTSLMRIVDDKYEPDARALAPPGATSPVDFSNAQTTNEASCLRLDTEPEGGYANGTLDRPGTFPGRPRT